MQATNGRPSIALFAEGGGELEKQGKTKSRVMVKDREKVEEKQVSGRCSD